MNTLAQMTAHGHELVAFHQDPGSGLRAIVAVHSTALGPGFGGARRWYYATEADALYDVLRLAEGMTWKAAAADVPIGGGKAVVLLPRPGHAATEAEARALGRFVETLGGRYVSAEDVGLTPEYVDWMAEETAHVTGGSGSGGDPSPHTARGVVNAMEAALTHVGRPVDFAGVTVAIQGAGNVGGHVARILADAGATLLVADPREERVRELVDACGATAVAPADILLAPCDILAPCALGGVIDSANVPRLRCAIVCGGANNVLVDYHQDCAALETRGVVYVPDFVANAGGLIELAGGYVGLDAAARRRRIDGIRTTVLEVLRDDSASSAHAAALALARRRIEAGRLAQPASS